MSRPDTRYERSNPDGFRLGVVLEAGRAALAPEFPFLEFAERQRLIGHEDSFRFEKFLNDEGAACQAGQVRPAAATINAIAEALGVTARRLME